MYTRIEHDFLGELEIPQNAYYGIQTARAMHNFQITGQSIASIPELIIALAQVKKAAATANVRLEVLEEDIFSAICQSCDEIISGKWHDQFPVDCIQGGAGTSTNMNANEVIANRSLEIMGYEKGEYQYCHPNNHVNCSQSTNDVYPTALRIALYSKLAGLISALCYLQKGFLQKSKEFTDVVKIGRTQLQDAVPITLGMEFCAYATTLEEDINRLNEARELLLEVNIGATAVGTGICSPSGYFPLVVQILAEVTGHAIVPSKNLVEATWDTGAYVQISSVLKRTATKISKICNDLRLLSSGPRGGLNEIILPQVQPGSSIMPGKVNPVIPELVNQICFDIIGKDVTISIASESAQLELNAMEPIIAFCLFNGIDHLTRGIITLQDLCIYGIKANKEHCKHILEKNISSITTLIPFLGYEKATEIAREASKSNLSIYNFIIEKKIIDEKILKDIFSPKNMLHPYTVKK